MTIIHRTAYSRGCVKTRLHVKFGGRRTLGNLAKIDPGAIWCVGLSFTADPEKFSHRLSRQRSTRETSIVMLSRPKNITLVLGAGASHPMGYPVGAGLRSKILDLGIVDRQSFAIPAGLYHEDGLLQIFVDSFRRSQMFSIDAFLARRPEFSEIGKRSIAALLLEVEDEQRLLNTERRDHW